jgi:hypothetical protein
MAANAIQNKRGVPGKKIYENKPPSDQFAGMDLKEKLRSVVAYVRTCDREQRIRRNTVFYLMALYYQGYQNVELSPGTSTFDIYERDDFYVENQFRHHVDAVVNSISKNEGDIVIRPASSNPKDITKARVAGPILDMQKATIGYPRVRDLKNLYKALFGNAFIFVDYIRDKKYGSIVTPKFEYQEIPDELDPTAEPYMSKVPAGVSSINKGREVSVVCSPLEIGVRSDTKGFENLPWLQWISRQDNEVLNYMYPGLGASGGSSAVDDDLSQQYLDVLAQLPGSVLGDAEAINIGNAQVKKSEYGRTWLEPCMFANDSELLRLFPTGVHVATVNGQVVDYYEESLFDRWTHEVLIPVPHSLLGDGLYDALLLQDIINEANSLILQHVRYSTVGHNVYDSTMIDPKDIVNDPKNGWVPAKPGLEKKISESVYPVHPQQLSGDVPQWLAAKLGSMQDMTSAYDSSVGKSLGANTPYSQSVFLNERAQSRWQGSLSYNRPEMVRFHQQLLKIAQTEWLEGRSNAIIANTGAWSFQEFQQADLDGEIDISFSNADMAPKSRSDQIQALTMLGTMMPLIAALPPKQKLRVEEILGLPPDANPTSTQLSRAYRQIDRITNGEVVTPLPGVDDPNLQAPVLVDFLASEDGESLALSDPQTFSNVYTYWAALMHMLQMQQGFVQPGPNGPQQPQQANGGPQAGAPGKPPGGQPGQQGGGPKGGPGSPTQPQAQTPSQPAPPVASPAA